MGAIGVYLGWGNLKESNKDVQALHKMNGNRLGRFRVMRVIAYGHYRNDLFRLAKHVTVLVIGVMACVLPKARGTSNQLSPTSIVITVGLFTILLLIIMASALDRRQRDAVEEIEEARNNEDESEKEDDAKIRSD